MKVYILVDHYNDYDDSSSENIAVYNNSNLALDKLSEYIAALRHQYKTQRCFRQFKYHDVVVEEWEVE